MYSNICLPKICVGPLRYVDTPPPLTVTFPLEEFCQVISEFSQVCRHWNVCANFGSLWKRCAYQLGVTEGVGNIVQVMETIIKHYKHSLSGLEKDVVDWKRVYRDLMKLVQNMKHLVIKTVTASESAPSELEERLKKATTRNQACNMLSLIEMLEIC